MNAVISPGNKSRYDAFCKDCRDIPVFLAPWWLDLDAGPDKWDVVLLENNGELVGALPFCLTRLKWFQGIGMPMTAPYQGYILRFPPDQQKISSRIAWEQKAATCMFQALPSTHFFFQHFPPEIENWTPLSWLGYRQTTRYSYVIKDLSCTSAVFEGFENRARTAIRKAEQSLRVIQNAEVHTLLELISHTYQKQSLRPPYDLKRLSALLEAAANHGAGTIYTALDERGVPHAGSFVVWDRQIARYVIQAADPALLHSGGAALLVWKALQEAAHRGMRSFDFTGSMMPNVEKFLRQFGGKPVPRHYITKENTALFYWLMRLKEFREQTRQVRL
jgi:hypothetical protein